MVRPVLTPAERDLKRLLLSRTSLSVTEFGAKADGVSDDTAAIQAAVDAAAASGGVVLLNGRTFLLASGPVVVPSHVRIQGLGRELTRVDCTGSSVGFSYTTAAEGGHLDAGQLADLHIEKATSANIVVDGSGASGAGVRGFNLLRVRSWRSQGDGLQMKDAWNWSVRDCSFYANSGWGVDSSLSWAGEITACAFTSNDGGVKAGGRTVLSANTYETNTSVGISASGVHCLTVVGGYVEAESGLFTAGKSVLSVTNCEGVALLNFPIETIDGTACVFDGSTGVVIGVSRDWAPMTTTEFPLSRDGHVALEVLNGSRVGVSSLYDMPVWVDSTSDLVFLDESAPEPRNLLVGAGSPVTSGSPTVTTPTWHGRSGTKIVSSASWDRVNWAVPGGLKVGQEYTIGCWFNAYSASAGALVGFEYGTGAGSIKPASPTYNSGPTGSPTFDRPRFAVAHFTAGSGDSHVGLYTDTAGVSIEIADLQLVEGTFHVGTWPRPSAFASTPTDSSWTAWSPTFTGITVGNGTVSARYRLDGRTLHWHYQLVLGSTSAVGTNPKLATPSGWKVYNAGNTVQTYALGKAFAYDSSAGAFFEGGCYGSDSSDDVLTTRIIFNSTTVNAAAPFTWASGDILVVSGTCEVEPS